MDVSSYLTYKSEHQKFIHVHHIIEINDAMAHNPILTHNKFQADDCEMTDEEKIRATVSAKITLVLSLST